MTTIHDVLADLAEDAPAVTPDPGLWARGRRWHRVRRGGTAAIALTACLLLLAVGLVSWRQSASPIQPAATGDAAALPSQLHAPSPWLPGTDEQGTLGRVSAIVLTERGGWGGSTAGVVGISATTGEYRFLDLPDVALSVSGDIALAPDGRHLAYWITGDTTGSPNTDGGSPATGVAVYDTVTGDVGRHFVPTEHGLSPDVLAWADDSRLLLEYHQWVVGDEGPEMKRGSATAGDGLLVWGTSTNAPPTHVGKGEEYDGEFIAVAGDGRFVVQRNDEVPQYAVVDLDSPRRPRPFGLADNTSSKPLVDATGRRVGAIWGGPETDSDYAPNELLAGRVREDAVPLPHVPDSDGTWLLEGWTDLQHIAVRHVDTDTGSLADLRRIDVRTGDVEVLTTFPTDGDAGSSVFATDLYAVPSRDFPAPPSPMDPRLVAGLAGGIVLAAAVALLLWRRRGVV